MAFVRKLLDVPFKISTSVELRIAGVQDLHEDLLIEQGSTWHEGLKGCRSQSFSENVAGEAV